MTLVIQIRMKVTVVNIIQNWMTLIIQIQMKVTVVNIIQNRPSNFGCQTFTHPKLDDIDHPDSDESNSC